MPLADGAAAAAAAGRPLRRYAEVVQLANGWWVANTGVFATATAHRLEDALRRACGARGVVDVGVVGDARNPDGVAGSESAAVMAKAAHAVFSSPRFGTHASPVHAMLAGLAPAAAAAAGEEEEAGAVTHRTLSLLLEHAAREALPRAAEAAGTAAAVAHLTAFDALLVSLCAASEVELAEVFGLCVAGGGGVRSVLAACEDVCRRCMVGEYADDDDEDDDVDGDGCGRVMEWAPVVGLLYGTLTTPRPLPLPQLVHRVAACSADTFGDHAAIEPGAVYGWAPPFVATADDDAAADAAAAGAEGDGGVLWFRVRGLTSGAVVPHRPQSVLVPPFCTFRVVSVREEDGARAGCGGVLVVTMEYLGCGEDTVVSPQDNAGFRAFCDAELGRVAGRVLEIVSAEQPPAIDLPLSSAVAAAIITDSSLSPPQQTPPPKAAAAAAAAVSERGTSTLALAEVEDVARLGAALAAAEESLAEERRRTQRLRGELGEAVAARDGAAEESRRDTMRLEGEVERLEYELEESTRVCVGLDETLTEMERRAAEAERLPQRAPVAEALGELCARVGAAKRAARDVRGAVRGNPQRARELALLVAAVDDAQARAKLCAPLLDAPAVPASSGSSSDAAASPDTLPPPRSSVSRVREEASVPPLPPPQSGGGGGGSSSSRAGSCSPRPPPVHQQPSRWR